MTDDDRRLAERLRRYEARVPFDAEAPVTTRSRAVPWGTLAGVAAMLVLAVGIATSLIARQPASGEAPFVPSPSVASSGSPMASVSASERVVPSVSSGPTTSATPAQTAIPTPTAPSGPAHVAWEMGGPIEGRVNAIASLGGAWIAGGSIIEGADARPAVWRSSNGLDWTGPIILPPEPVERDGFTPRYWINGFGTWRGTLLAFGWNGVGCCDGGYPMLWQSVDGVSWTEVETAGTAFGDSYHAPHSSMVAADGSLVVLSHTGLGSGASVFSTTDLETWREYPITSTDPTFMVEAFAASPNGWLAVGSSLAPWTDRPRPEQRAWWSADGLTWAPVAPPAPGGELRDIAWDGGRERFVVVGRDDQDLPAVWLTEDGRTWARTALADEPGAAESVAVADGLLVVGGIQGTPSTMAGPGWVWSSHDGVMWDAVQLTDHISPLAATTGNRAVIALNGWSESGPDESWSAWAGAVAD